VLDILRSKFSSYSDFHTLLYTCAREFDFLDAEMPWKTSKTLLLPAAACIWYVLAAHTHIDRSKCVARTKAFLSLLARWFCGH